MTPEERTQALEVLAGQINAMDVALGAARKTLALLTGPTETPKTEPVPQAPQFYNGVPVGS